tara:strand:+ start:728 stop:892 length:165 start_codon:yes stop_codon:yes gene_type:complete
MHAGVTPGLILLPAKPPGFFDFQDIIEVLLNPFVSANANEMDYIMARDVVPFNV